MLPHRIRLRGPWDLTPIRQAGDQSAALPASIVAKMPARWQECGLTEFTGRVRQVRRFGLPRKLDACERVWLTFDGISGQSDLWLNDEFLGTWPDAASPFEVEVTGKLLARNELRVEIESMRPGGGMWADAALEIRAQAWLTGLMARIHDHRLILHGAVRGRADGPLDLYAILGRTTAIQARVDASESGCEFEAASDILTPERIETATTVELIAGSVVWHSASVALANK